jgi:ubiquinone/menaquinone biosynthesis C-methylase UbiE
MGQLTDTQTLNNQYGTADKLNTRISIHAKYSVNKQGFGNWITEHYCFPEHASVLELGCGTGDMWKGKSEIIARCDRLILSDFSAGMLDKAKETLSNENGIDYQVIDIQEIPCPDQSFDAVIANMMLYHVPDLRRGLAEVRRVLKPGGIFCCATYGENGIMEYLCSLFGREDLIAQANHSFTLQNGGERLRDFFRDVTRYDYPDSLAVTDVRDLADYVRSLTGMADFRNIPEEEMLAVFTANMKDGVLSVPKEYGMFVCR